MQDTNSRGEYALWDKGRFLRYAKVEYVDGKMVLAEHKATILAMKEAAAQDGILLVLVSGLRTFTKQYKLRVEYRQAYEDSLAAKKIPFESHVNDDHFILNADSSQFLPPCARPGWSNHQDGGAYDFRTKDDPNTPQDESLAFEWLSRRAIEWGFIRTVASERWHWELRPGEEKYARVPENHISWKPIN